MALLSIKRVAVSVILGLVTFAAFHLTSTGHPSFRIQYHANKSASVEIFFDTGAGFNADESFRQTLAPTNTWMEILFPLPKSIIKRLRFDPADGSGSLNIMNIQIVDPLGLEIMRISPETFHPEKEIQSLVVNGRSLEIVTLPEAEDPMLSIPLDSNLDLRGGGYAFSKYAFLLLVWVSVWVLLGAAVVHFKLFSLLSTLPTQAPWSNEYLSEIDGLRAIAVLAVLLFHLDIAYVPGGYLGVDIFFVISGFLITRLIANEFRETGRFRFGNFYLRRVRRLFPAFFVTIVISLIGATFLFEPNDLERTGGAALHAIASISNVFFWSEAGYFDADSRVKPLLHTWSLSVEEQFYLLWPSVLVCLMITKIKWVPVLVVLLLCVASLYWRFSFADGEIALFANLGTSVPEWLTLERWFSDGSATIFFLLPFRVFELGLGAAMVWVVGQSRFPNVVREVILGIGFCLILWAVLSIDKKDFTHPLMILAPTIGACLVIFAGGAKFLGGVLRNSVMVGMGLISYSLYLIHWPIIVLFRYYNFGSLSWGETILTASLSVGMAALMYRFVEQPWRSRRVNILDPVSRSATARSSDSTFVLSVFALALLVALPSASIWKFQGWAWRYPEAVQEILLSGPERRRESWEVVGRWGSAEYEEDRFKVLIIGDSHSKDLWNALWYSDLIKDKISLRRLDFDEGCIPMLNPNADSSLISFDQRHRCATQVDRFISWPRVQQADAIVFTFRWTDFGINGLGLLLSALEKTGYSGKIALFGRTIEFSDFPRLIARFGSLDDKGQLAHYVAKHRDTSIDEINERLEREARKLGITFFSKDHHICSADYKSCTALVGENIPLIYDYGHWTVPGAQHIGQKITRNDTFRAFLNNP